MRRRPTGALGVVLTLVALALYWALPAGSQTTGGTCTLTESLQVTTGNPVISNTTPLIEFAPGSGSSSVTAVIGQGAQFCDMSGRERSISDPTQERSWTVTQISGNQATYTPPVGWTVVNAVVRATDLAATTTTTTSTSTSSTTSTSTTTTTTTTVPGPGPGNGPNSIRPEARADNSPDAAAVRGENRLDVVVVGTDDRAYWSSENWPSPWTAYTDLGAPPGGIVGNASIVSWGPGRLDVFARGSDNRLWQNYSESGGANWSGWLKPFGDDGELRSAPETSSRGFGRLNVFVLGTDGNIWERFYDGAWNSGWNFQGAPSPGISSGSDPTSVSWGDSERIDLFSRGADNNLWQKTWDGAAWSNWFRPQAGSNLTLASEPEATSWEPGNILVFARGPDGGAYALPFGPGGWGSWVRLVRGTDTWLSGPGATSRGLGRFDLFMRGTDNLTYHIWQ